MFMNERKFYHKINEKIYSDDLCFVSRTFGSLYL